MINHINTSSRLRLLGVNDDKDSCSCCGKTGLKRVVWLQDTDTGEIAYFGTTCATKRAPALFGKGESAQTTGNKNIRNLCSFIHFRILPQTEAGKAAKAALEAAEGKSWDFRVATVFPANREAERQEESLRLNAGLSADGKVVLDWDTFAAALDSVDWS